MTLPGTYHEVINMGPNLAEAVNFGFPGWEELALFAFSVLFQTLLVSRQAVDSCMMALLKTLSRIYVIRMAYTYRLIW